MIKIVFLDIDNTLLSFSEYLKESMRTGFSAFGLKPYTEEMFPVVEEINHGLWKQIEQGLLTYEELLEIRWNKIFSQLGIDFDGRVFETYFKEQLFYSAIPEEGALELLEYLSGKYVLCAASNGPFEQQLNRLRKGNMYDYFSYFFISSKIGAQKPGRDFFDQSFRELRGSGFPKLIPEETMIIGDSVSSDISGGKDYGMHTCLYQKVPDPETDVSKADHVVRSLTEIRNILN